MTALEAIRVILASDDARRAALSIQEQLKADKKRSRSARKAKAKSLSLPGKTKEQRDEDRDALYLVARMQAFLRAGRILSLDGNVITPARCEVQGCTHEGTDPDHVIGGASKADSESLGAEGLQVMCRSHHDLKTVNSPTRRFWLDQAKAHALKHGYRRLLTLVEKAIARDEMKHPERRSTEP